MKKAAKKIIETTGKIEDAPERGKPITFTRLEQVWGGFNERSRYGTLQESEYLAQLNDMNRTDMETHARKLGVVVLESSARLRDSLIKEFNVYVNTLTKPATTTTSAATTKPIQVSDEVKRILAEGK